jgi:peptidoglycan hydrolase-like protein with peptidoglycan-binding domain
VSARGFFVRRDWRSPASLPVDRRIAPAGAFSVPVSSTVALGAAPRSSSSVTRQWGRGQVIALQRSAGNQATALLVQRETVTQQMAGRPKISRATWRSKPAATTELQQALNADGATPALVVDGVFGPLTDSAVRVFQGRHGLKVDGICGPMTWGMVGSLGRLGGASPADTLSSTTPLDQTKHDAIEAVLHPPQPSPPSGGPPPAHPPMTGAGQGGAFQTDAFSALDAFLTSTAASMTAPGGVTVNNTADVSGAAQEETERFYGPWLTMASRTPTGAYHPGNYTPPIRDARTRTVDVSERWGWTLYFLRDPSYPTHQPLIAHQVHEEPGRPDSAEVDRVGLAYAQQGSPRSDRLREVIQHWPAEAGSGTVFVNTTMHNMAQLQAQYDLFTTLIHEFLHLVTHPNYNRVARAVGGTAQQILIEGMTEHLRHQVWLDVLPGLAGNTALRQRIEGSFFVTPADATAFVPHSFYDQKADADSIAATAGEANARAAYLMGHSELLGIGAGTASVAPLTGLAEWSPSDADSVGRYTVPSGGETLGRILTRTGAASASELDGTPVTDLATGFAAGHSLRVPGIRYHRSIAEDTIGQVAAQYGLPQPSLERANGLSPGQPQTPVPPSSMLLIPAS